VLQLLPAISFEFIAHLLLNLYDAASANSAIDLTYSSDDIDSSVVGSSVCKRSKRKRSKRGRPKKEKVAVFFPSRRASAFSYTTNAVYFEVNGRPVPKKRAAWGRNNNCYNPSQSEEREFASVVNDTFVGRLGQVPSFHHTLALAIDVCFKFPNQGTSIMATADIDNLCKFVLDALNGVLYHDDRQIVTLKASKLFDSSHQLGCTTVSISILDLAA
jgi:Holliday junction resolvase RusA-like endonuclease